MNRWFSVTLVVGLAVTLATCPCAAQATPTTNTPADKELVRVDSHIVGLVGPATNPVVLLTGQNPLSDYNQVVFLDGLTSVVRVSAQETGIRGVGASANGQWITILRQRAGEEQNKWELSLIRRIPAGPGTGVRVSDDGSTILVVDIGMRSEGHVPGVRSYDENGNLRGELRNEKETAYDVSACRMTCYRPNYDRTPIPD